MLKLENLREGEKMILAVRRHWIIYVFLVLYSLLGLGVIIIIFSVIGMTFFSTLLIIVYSMILSIFLYVEWLNHELDLYIVTNNRIIGVDQISFLNRTVSECNLGQVQEVNSKTKGFLPNILNYGTLLIQTAGNNTTLQMDFAPDVMQQARKILNIVDEYRDNHSVKNNSPEKQG